MKILQRIGKFALNKEIKGNSSCIWKQNFYFNTDKINNFILCSPLEKIENNLRLGRFNQFSKEIMQLLDNNYFPPLIYFNNLFMELIEAKEIDYSIELFNIMKEYNIKPNDITYSYLIEGCLEEGLFEKGFSFMIEAYLGKEVLDLQIYELMITHCKNQHHSYSTLIYEILKNDFNPSFNIIKKLFKLAHKYNDSHFLNRLQNDLNIYTYIDIKKLDLKKERIAKKIKTEKKIDTYKQINEYYPNPNELISELTHNNRKNKKNDLNQKMTKNILKNMPQLQRKAKNKMITLMVAPNDLKKDRQFQNEDLGSDNEEFDEDSYEEEEFSNETNSSSESSSEEIIRNNDNNKESDTEQLK